MNAPILANRPSTVRRWHSIWLRLLGFVWLFAAVMLLAVGAGLGLLGIGGGLLVRLNPDTTTLINYDPSTVALFSPVPFCLGCILVLWFLIRMKRSDR